MEIIYWARFIQISKVHTYPNLVNLFRDLYDVRYPLEVFDYFFKKKPSILLFLLFIFNLNQYIIPHPSYVLFDWLTFIYQG